MVGPFVEFCHRAATSPIPYSLFTIQNRRYTAVAAAGLMAGWCDAVHMFMNILLRTKQSAGRENMNYEYTRNHSADEISKTNVESTLKNMEDER